MLAQLCQRRHHSRREPPGSVQVPAALARAAALGPVQADVVPDGTAGGLRRPLAPTVGEGHRAGQPVGGCPTRRVRQGCKRGRQPDLQPAPVGMHPDGLVAPGLVGLAIGGEEQPLRLPPSPPLRHGQRGVVPVEGVAELREPTPPTAHRHPTSRDALLDLGQPRLHVLEAALLLEPLRPTLIRPRPALPLSCRHGQPRPELPGCTLEPHPGIQQVITATLPLVVGGPRDRPRPARRAGGSHGLLADRALVGAWADLAAEPEVLPGEAAKLLTDRLHDRLIPLRGAQPGTDAGAGGWGDHKRGGQATH
jgi:hypothetical protein